MLHGRRQRGEHQGKAEHEWQEPEAEHHVDDERHDEEREPLVAPQGAQERAHRERRAAEVKAHHRDAGGLHSDHEREHVPDEVVEEVLRVQKVEAVDVREPEGGIAVIVDEPQRGDVKGQILERRVLDDPRRRRGEDRQRNVEQRPGLHGRRAESHAPKLHEMLGCAAP